jgi:uncharacterized membrane protein YobD (UPF0266 family)
LEETREKKKIKNKLKYNWTREKFKKIKKMEKLEEEILVLNQKIQKLMISINDCNDKEKKHKLEEELKHLEKSVDLLVLERDALALEK